MTAIESSSTTAISNAPQFPTARPGMGFNEASAAVVDYLKSVLPMGFWAITRFDGLRSTSSGSCCRPLSMRISNGPGRHESSNEPR